MTTAYNFNACSQPELAARIASLRTADIQSIFKDCFGATVNIMQKFAKPPKCNAAIYIVENAPSDMLNIIIARDMAEYEAAANNGAGRPVNKYRHDPNHDNTAWNARSSARTQNRTATVEVETVPPNATDTANEVERIIKDMDETGTGTGTSQDDSVAEGLAKAVAALLDEGRIRDIARQEDAKIVAHVDEAVAEAIAKVAMPTRVIVQYAEDETAVRDAGIQHHNFPRLLSYCQQRDRSGCRPNIWLPGPAGSGKTTAAENLAKYLDVPYGYMGALMDKTEAFGYMDAHGNYVETEFYRRWKDGGVFLWDESDGSDPMQAVCMNAALAGKWAAFPCGMVERHKDFIFLAAANTYGNGADGKYVGRNMLDKATLDRFIKLPWNYDDALESMIIGNEGWLAVLRKARASAERCGLDIVISTRAGQRCVMLEQAGHDTRDEIIEIVFRDGLTDDQWNQFKRGII